MSKQKGLSLGVVSRGDARFCRAICATRAWSADHESWLQGQITNAN
jgi:hypothetical protein